MTHSTHSTWTMTPMATWARGVFDKPTILVPGTPHGRTTHTTHYGRPAEGWRPLRHAAKSRRPTQQRLTGLRRNTNNVSWEHTGQRTSHPNLSRQTTAATRPLRPPRPRRQPLSSLESIGAPKMGSQLAPYHECVPTQRTFLEPTIS